MTGKSFSIAITVVVTAFIGLTASTAGASLAARAAAAVPTRGIVTSISTPDDAAGPQLAVAYRGPFGAQCETSGDASLAPRAERGGPVTVYVYPWSRCDATLDRAEIATGGLLLFVYGVLWLLVTASGLRELAAG